VLVSSVRRMALSISAQLGTRPDERWKPGVWDPLVRLDWRWSVRLDLTRSSFGVGNDADISGNFRADWRFTNHFGLAMGYAALHFQDSTTVLNRFTRRDRLSMDPFSVSVFIFKSLA
jgi:hypothetical protein